MGENHTKRTKEYPSKERKSQNIAMIFFRYFPQGSLLFPHIIMFYFEHISQQR